MAGAGRLRPGEAWKTFAFLLASAVWIVLVEGSDSSGIVFLDNERSEFFQAGGLQKEFAEDTIRSTTAVLLGVTPPRSIDALQSARLEGLLANNPFHRPRAVLTVLVSGLDAGPIQHLVQAEQWPSHWRSLEVRSGKTLLKALSEVVRSSGDHVHEFQLTSQGSFCGASCLEQALADLAVAVGGAFKKEPAPLQGPLTFAAENGQLVLDFQKDADFLLATELAAFWHAVEKAAESAGSGSSPKFFSATLEGLQAIRATYEGEDDAKVLQCAELLVKVVLQAVARLQAARQGRLTAQVAFLGEVDLNGQKVAMPIRAAVAAHRRRLAEDIPAPTLTDSNITEKAHKLVNRAVAWGTGIMLLIALLISVCFLFGMPVTKDTLLYSRAKLD